DMRGPAAPLLDPTTNLVVVGRLLRLAHRFDLRIDRTRNGASSMPRSKPPVSPCRARLPSSRRRAAESQRAPSGIDLPCELRQLDACALEELAPIGRPRRAHDAN